MLSRSQRRQVLRARNKAVLLGSGESPSLPAYQQVPSTHQSHGQPPMQRSGPGKKNIIKTFGEKK